MIERQKKLLLALLAGAALLLSGSGWGAPSEDELFGDKFFRDRYDFIASVKVQRLENFLKYKGSGLYPVGELAVTYRVCPREYPERATELKHYEDLWYHEAKPLGCRRYCDMPVVDGSSGCINILPGETVHEFPDAIANAAIRLILDMNLHQCACLSVIVPQDCFGSIYSSFSRFGFYEIQQKPETALPAKIFITIETNPPSQSKRVCFPDKW